MKTLNRLLLLLLALTLLVTTYAMHAGMTRASIGHEMTYTLKWPWLSEVREISLYGVLGWCVLFVRSQPAFVRIGLVTVILAFVLMALPPKVIHELPTPPGLH